MGEEGKKKEHSTCNTQSCTCHSKSNYNGHVFYVFKKLKTVSDHFKKQKGKVFFFLLTRMLEIGKYKKERSDTSRFQNPRTSIKHRMNSSTHSHKEGQQEVNWNSKF